MSYWDMQQVHPQESQDREHETLSWLVPGNRKLTGFYILKYIYAISSHFLLKKIYIPLDSQ